MTAEPTRPAPVPKAGFWARMKGGDKPTGTLKDAWNLIRAKDIESGRELLRRICKHEPQNFDAHVLAAYEVDRPPADKPECVRLLRRAEEIVSGSCEVQCFFAIAGVISLQVAGIKDACQAYFKVRDVAPRSAHGAALMLLADAFMSDVMIQILTRPEGTDIPGLYIQPGVKGAALLMERRLDEALEQFRGARNRLDELARGYEAYFKFPLTEDQRGRIRDQLRGACLGAEGLTLREMGRDPEAKDVFREYSRLFPKSSRSVRLLLDEPA